MIVFNFDPTDHIEVRTDEDGGILRFDEHTFGINRTSDGYSLTNDWNTRHLTVGFSNDSCFYHLTREDIDQRVGKRSISRGEYIAEMLLYIRSTAPEMREEELPFDVVGKLNIDGTRDYFLKHNVVEFLDDGLDVNLDRARSLVDEIVETPSLFGKLLGSVFDPVETSKLRDVGDIVYFYPGSDELEIIVLYPNNRVGVAKATEILDNPLKTGGSQIIDHTLRSITTD